MTDRYANALLASRLRGLTAPLYRLLNLTRDAHFTAAELVGMLALNLLLAVLYLVAGAGLFSQLYGWGFFEGVWFSFVTLTTIGYGDFAPAFLAGEPPFAHPLALLCQFLYIIIGCANIGKEEKEQEIAPCACFYSMIFRPNNVSHVWKNKHSTRTYTSEL